MEIQKIVLERLPPGDRWVPNNSHNENLDTAIVLPTLTDALNYVFEKTGYKKYYIDAAAGEVYSVTEEEDTPVPQKKFSIYED